MSRCYGAFELYTDAAGVVDELPTVGVAEDAVNLIANARTAGIAATAFAQPVLSKTPVGAPGPVGTFADLLRTSHEVGTPDAGAVIAAGATARELVRRSSGLSPADATLGEKLTGSLKVPSNEAESLCRIIRAGGVVIWAACESETCDTMQALYNKYNALLTAVHDS